MEIEMNGKDGATSPPGLTKVDKELCAATLAGIDACLNALSASGIHADKMELPAAPGSTGHAGTSDVDTADVVASSPDGQAATPNLKNDEYMDDLLDDTKAAADKELVRKPATTENVENKLKAVGRELDRLSMGLKPAPKVSGRRGECCPGSHTQIQSEAQERSQDQEKTQNARAEPQVRTQEPRCTRKGDKENPG